MGILCEVPFSTVQRVGRRKSGFSVVLSRGELVQLWAGLWQPPALPTIDFSRSCLVAVFMGEQPTGGYSITIQRMQAYDQEVSVDLLVKKPSRDDFVPLVVTFPGHLVQARLDALPRGKVKFVFFDQEGPLGELDVSL